MQEFALVFVKLLGVSLSPLSQSVEVSPAHCSLHLVTGMHLPRVYSIPWLTSLIDMLKSIHLRSHPNGNSLICCQLDILSLITILPAQQPSLIFHPVMQSTSHQFKVGLPSKCQGKQHALISSHNKTSQVPRHNLPLMNPCWLSPVTSFMVFEMASRMICTITVSEIAVRLTILLFPIYSLLKRGMMFAFFKSS